MKKLIIALIMLITVPIWATVTTTSIKTSAVGSGSAGQVVSFTFPIVNNSDITVIVRDAAGDPTTWSETTNYTITNNGANGGSITTVTAVETTEEVHIISTRALTQGMTLVPGGWDTDAMNAAFDKAIILIQQLEDAKDRSVRAPVTDAIALDLELPNSIDRASKNLGFDPSGNVTVTDSSGTFKTTNAYWDDLITKSPWFDVRAYGATGNGETDDKAAIQAAIDAAEAAGAGKVFFPKGTYSIASVLTVDSNNVQLVGRGYGSKIIRSTDGDVLEVDGASGFAVSNLYFEGTGSYVTLTGCINIDGCSNFIVQNCWFTSSSRQGIRIDDSSNGIIIGNRCWANYQDGIMIRGGSSHILCQDNFAYDNVTTDVSIGIHIYNATKITVAGNHCYGNIIDGITLESDADNNVIKGNYCYNNGRDGICLAYSDENLITGNYCYDSTAHGISVEISDENLIIGNYANSNTLAGINVHESNEVDVSNNYVLGSGTYGIAVTTDDGTDVTDNNIRGNFLSDNTGQSIFVNWDCLRTNIINNKIINGDAAAILINRADVIDTIVKGNEIYNTTPLITDYGTGTKVEDKVVSYENASTFHENIPVYY